MRLYWSEAYLGIKWLSGGRNADSGLDCWGLLRYLYQREFNIELTDYAAPLNGLAPSLEVVQKELDRNIWEEVDTPRDGDAVALGKDGEGLSHVGVYIETPVPSIIHTAFDCPSSILSLQVMARKGFKLVRFYRHAHRSS